jgi:hypothetical protein
MPEEKATFEEEGKGENISPEVKEVYAKLREYANHPARSKWTKRRDEAWKGGIENEQWDEKEKQDLQEQNMVPLVINKCNKGIQASCAMATYKKPEAVFMPIGSGDLYVAEIFKRAYDYNWAVNNGNLVGYDVVEESKIGGMGFFDTYWDSNKGIMGRIVLEDADPTCIYWDPKSRKRDLSDSDIIKARLRTRKYIKENYDKISDQDLEMKWSLDEAQETEGITTGDNYKEFEGEQQTRPDQKGDEKEKPSVWEIQALLLKTVKEDWVVMYDQDGNPTAEQLDPEKWTKGEKNAQGQQILTGQNGEEGLLWRRVYEKRVYRLVVGKKLITEEENPYGLDSDRDPVINLIPVRHQRTRTSYPMSPTNYALPINKEKNKRRAQFILHVSHNVNSPIVEPEGTKWRDRKGKEASPGTPGTTGTIPKTASQFPMRLTPGALQAELFGALEDRADRDIDQQYDAPPIVKGEVPQGMDPSGRAVLALQDMAGVMGTPFMTTLEAAIAQTAKVLTYLSLKHWPRQMWRRLIDDKEWNDETVVDPKAGPGEVPQQNPMQAMMGGMPEEPTQGSITAGQRWQEALEKIRPEDPTQEPGISLIDLDVKVLAGSSMPTNRIARQQVALEMKAQGVYDAEAVLDYTDDPAKDKILPRIREMEKAAAVEAAMKAQKTNA